MDLQHVLAALAHGNYETTLHARRRMAERNVTHKDILQCGATGHASLEKDGKVRVDGFDCDGDDLTLVCVDEGGVLIITVF